MIEHIGLHVKDIGVSKAFYVAALKPGLRKDYSPTYYAAFVLDPDGNNIEVVCHT